MQDQTRRSANRPGARELPRPFQGGGNRAGACPDFQRDFANVVRVVFRGQPRDGFYHRSQQSQFMHPSIVPALRRGLPVGSVRVVGSEEDPRIKLQKSSFEGGFRPENHGICSFMLSHREYATPVWQNKKQTSRGKMPG